MNAADANREGLRGVRIALTGRFASMSQAELAAVIEEFGGRHVHSPRRDTDWLVVGAEGLPLRKDGRPHTSLEKARTLRAAGYRIEIVSEEQFLDRIGLGRPDSRSRGYTLVQLSRILDVPGRRIRSWVRAGLIEPVERVQRLAFFDFHQVAGAKAIRELAEAGLPLATIRERLEPLRRLLPGIEAPLSQVSILERNPRMLVRLQNGQLSEPSGQLHFDFDAATDRPQTVNLEPPSRSADAWFDEAVVWEDAGRFSEAAEAYRQAIDIDPGDPILHFNLGNVLFQLGRAEDSMTHYRRAVQIDAGYVEAWNNLGSVLLQLERADEAITPFERALQLVPAYADAHFNLATALDQLGDTAAAARHWRSYLKLDPDSPWAAIVRQRLEASGMN